MQCWALKTTRGPEGAREWPNFKREGVIAIGWHTIDIDDPSKVNDQTLRLALLSAYPAENPDYCARAFRTFIGFGIGDLVLICRGYTAVQSSDVFVHGLARVTGPFFVTPRDNKSWRFKRAAKLQIIERAIARDVIADALDRGSLRQTIHQLELAGIRQLARELGVNIEV